jgi:hypothetical protein
MYLIYSGDGEKGRGILNCRYPKSPFDLFKI